MTQKRRDTDKIIHRFKMPVHWLGGIFIGWMIKTYFPDSNALQLADHVWGWLLDSVQALGGLAAIASTIMAIFTVYKFIKERKK